MFIKPDLHCCHAVLVVPSGCVWPFCSALSALGVGDRKCPGWVQLQAHCYQQPWFCRHMARDLVQPRYKGLLEKVVVAFELSLKVVVCFNFVVTSSPEKEPLGCLSGICSHALGFRFEISPQYFTILQIYSCWGAPVAVRIWTTFPSNGKSFAVYLTVGVTSHITARVQLFYPWINKFMWF